MSHLDRLEDARSPLLGPAGTGGQAASKPDGSCRVPGAGNEEEVEGELETQLSGQTCGHHDADAAGNGWFATTLILLTDMFGIGALAVPSMFSRLGWLVGTGLLLALGGALVFCGSLFTRLACTRRDVSAYHRLAFIAYGGRGRALVYGTVYTLILLSPAVLHLTCVEAVRVVLGGGASPRFLGLGPGALVALVMLPLAQVRSMEDVGAVSVLGTGSMLAAAGVTLARLIAAPAPRAAARTHVLPPAGSGPRVLLVALLDAVFAYGGQQNWFRYASTMRRRSQFARVTRAGSAVMTGAYLMLGCVGYWSLGSSYDLSKPITSVLPAGGWTVFTNAMLLIHCLVAYQININVLTHLALTFLPARVREGSDTMSAASWFLFSTAGIGLSWALASSLPYFSLVIALIAAIGDVAAGYLLPALLSLKLLRLNAVERGVCMALVPTAVALSTAGIYAALTEISKGKAGAAGLAT